MIPNGSHLEPIARLVRLWLELCRHALSRRVQGGFLVALPDGQEWAILLDADQRAQLEDEAKRTLGTNWSLKTLNLSLDSRAAGDETKLQLSQVLDELQSRLLEPGEHHSGDAALLAFLLDHAGFRSQSVPLTRVAYHVTPNGEQWKVSRRGSDEEVLFSRKTDAVDEGVRRARSHPKSQLIIHLANGRFEEERTYGHDPGSGG